MNNENDKILDDLIQYYDGVEDELGGETTVIPAVKSEPAPAEEIFGDTVVVNVKPTAVEPEADVTRIVDVPVPDADSTRLVDVPAPEIPEDEVFGNLDIDGRVIEHEPEPPQRRVTEPEAPTYKDDTPTRSTGLWYALKPLWATIIVCAMLVGSYLFYSTDTGIIGIYKSNFNYNLSLILRVFGVDYDPAGDIPVVGLSGIITTAHAEGVDVEYDTIDEKKATIPFIGADIAQIQRYDKGVVCVKSNYICYIDKKGEKIWEHDTQISNPILSTSGKYIAVAGKDSKYLDLYKGKKLVYSIEISDKIRSCSVSEKGDVALVTDKSSYKGGVSVYNKKGEEVFSWVSGVNYITSAAMLKSRNVAVSLVSTENAVTSFVMVFDIYETDPINGAEISGSLIFDSLQYKKNAYISADNAIASVNSDGELNYSIHFDNMDIMHIATDKKGWRCVSYTDGNLPYINVYNRGGDFYASTPTEAVPDHIDLYKSVILYNNGHDILCGTVDNTKTRYSAPMTVKDLIMINKSTYMIVYENSLEIIKI